MPDPRPIRHVRAVAQRYPDAWDQLAQFRALRRAGRLGWPDWCYCPLAGAYAIVSGGADRTVPRSRMADVAVVAGLGAWRATQGIYRFDETLRTALTATPFDGAIPTEVLQRLPEWCVYVETPGATWAYGHQLAGFFAHLESDSDDRHVELRLLLDTDAPGRPVTLIPVPLRLGPASEPWPLGRAIAEAFAEIERHLSAADRSALVTRSGMAAAGGTWETALASAQAELRTGLPPLLNLLLYLASEGAEVRDPHEATRRPARPEPTRTKRGLREFPAARLSQWEVGARLGAALRRAERAVEREPAASEPGHHASPRPHIRRAHWHTFLAGPRTGERERRIKWLPPIPVNLDDPDQLPTTIHPVE